MIFFFCIPAWLPDAPAAGGVVISEIMAGPAPPVRLPEHEYIELYNRSAGDVELEGRTFTYGAVAKAFPQYRLPAGEYLLLVHPAAQTAMARYGATLPLLGSQTAVNNAGQYLQLRDPSGNIVSWVDFTAADYGDPLKADGGRSLEQIDPDRAFTLEPAIAVSGVRGFNRLQLDLQSPLRDDFRPYAGGAAFLQRMSDNFGCMYKMYQIKQHKLRYFFTFFVVIIFTFSENALLNHE